MSRPFPWILAAIAVTSLLAEAGRAAPAADPEITRLRGALRDATLQVRNMQTDLATAQATAAADADEKKQLAAQNELLTKHTVADKAENEKKLAALEKERSALKAQYDQLTAALAASRAEGVKLTQNLEASTAQGNKLSTELTAAQQRIVNLEVKNVALYHVGTDILHHFEDFSVSNALKAKEPFVGSARTRLENLVQDYRDKLSDQRDHQ